MISVSFFCETEEALACHREATHRHVPIGSQNTELTHADKTVFYCDKCEYTTDNEHSLQYHTPDRSRYHSPGFTELGFD